MSEPSTLVDVADQLKAEQAQRPWYWRAIAKAGWFIQDQWFLFGMAFVILIASQVQVPLSRQHLKDEVVTYLCPAVVFLITGCTLPTSVLIANSRRFRLHFFVQGCSFLLDSASVFAVVSLMATNPRFMDPALMVGMLFMASVPTTISTNVVMTRAAHGNEALTVVEATLGNVLGPFLTPLLLRMYLSSGAWYTHVVPAASIAFGPLLARVFKKLGLNMLVPLAVGQLIQTVFPARTKTALTRGKASKLGSLALLMIVWSTYDKAFATGAFGAVRASNLVLLVFASVAYYASWLALSVFLSRLWLDKRDTIAVAYCIPAKTPAMGIPLASVMFVGIDVETSAKLQIPLVIFQGLQIAAGSLGTIPFRRWVRAEEEAEMHRQDASNTSVLADVVDEGLPRQAC